MKRYIKQGISLNQILFPLESGITMIWDWGMAGSQRLVSFQAVDIPGDSALGKDEYHDQISYKGCRSFYDQHRYIYIVPHIIDSFTIDPVFQSRMAMAAKYEQVGLIFIDNTHDLLSPFGMA